MASLHIDYHAVLSAFQNHTTSCPLCSVIRDGERAFWDSTLYGAVGTEGFQDAFLAADGFCPTHTRALAERNDGVAVTMLYVPLLRHRLRWIEAKRGGVLQRGAQAIRRHIGSGGKSRSTPERRGSRAPRSDCPLCNRIDGWMHRFFVNLLRHQDDPELKRAIVAGEGLCVHHYRSLTNIAGRFRRVEGSLVPRPLPSAEPWLHRHHIHRWSARMDAAESEALQRGGLAWKGLLTAAEGDDVVP